MHGTSSGSLRGLQQQQRLRQQRQSSGHRQQAQQGVLVGRGSSSSSIKGTGNMAALQKQQLAVMGGGHMSLL